MLRKRKAELEVVAVELDHGDPSPILHAEMPPRLSGWKKNGEAEGIDGPVRFGNRLDVVPWTLSLHDNIVAARTLIFQKH